MSKTLKIGIPLAVLLLIIVGVWALNSQNGPVTQNYQQPQQSSQNVASNQETASQPVFSAPASGKADDIVKDMNASAQADDNLASQDDQSAAAASSNDDVSNEFNSQMQ